MPFTALGLSHELTHALKTIGFERPTPIQEKAIPPILESRDIMAAAETGSGKTAAFLLPLMQKILPLQRGLTRALVLVPTRELAAQIVEHFMQLTARTRLTAAAVHGGVGMGAQEQAFRKGVDFIVATPGRLLDHFRNSYAGLKALEYLVLDEADRMLDMGFMPDIKRILARIPRNRQTLLFSATMPQPIIELAREMLRDPIGINIERKSRPAEGITHAVYHVPSDLKSELFLGLLNNGVPGSVLVFTRTKHRANKLATFLEKSGVACERIHGNRSQSQRNAALGGFKSGRFQVLVATDIAARGIDVEALGLVVNYDVPHVPEDYIHRVGRTARASATGDAFTFVSPEEEKDFRAIERHLGKSIPRQRLVGFDYSIRKENPQNAHAAQHHARGGSRQPKRVWRS
jgi:ATP-dependent RNA helicase RhlE